MRFFFSSFVAARNSWRTRRRPRLSSGSFAIRTVSIFLALGISSGARLLARPPDAAEGKKIYAACSACHEVDKTNKLGPGLLGIVGRKAGSADGFRYSRAMKKSPIVWDERTLDAYLSNPQATIPGSVMPFPGLPDAGQRADLIEYLKTLK